MRITTKFLCISLIGLFMYTAMQAQQPATPATKPEGGLQDPVKNGQPGPMHQLLAKMTGNWHQEVKLWLKPDQPAAISTINGHYEMTLDGRFLQSRFEGTLKDQPIMAQSVMGYDNARQVFFSTWIDNQNTGMLYMEGKWLEINKKIELKGKMTDPETGKEIDVKEIITLVDDNNITTEMFMTINGHEFKHMETKSTRG
jgi:hypothetical protein